MEYVATTGSAVGHLREVEREQRLVGDERTLDRPERQRRVYSIGGGASDDDRGSSVVRVVDRLQVRAIIERERALEVDRAFECDLRDLAARRAEPALAHQNATVSPGSGATISTPGGASSRSAS